MKDLELFDNQIDTFSSVAFTIGRIITFFSAVVVHRAFYKMMKRLPGRAVNQIIYPYMVSLKCARNSSKIPWHLPG